MSKCYASEENEKNDIILSFINREKKLMVYKEFLGLDGEQTKQLITRGRQPKVRGDTAQRIPEVTKKGSYRKPNYS